MAEKRSPFDPAEFLDTPEAMESFLNDAFETGNSEYIAKAFGVVARAKGMTNVAGGLAREQLYTSLSEQGNPTHKTVMKIMQSWGLGIKVNLVPTK